GMTEPGDRFVRAARASDVQAKGCLAVQVNGHTVALFSRDGRMYAVDNRCPHMGFPLDRGTVEDGILTCHWHHARFDLASGGTFVPARSITGSPPWRATATASPRGLRFARSPGTRPTRRRWAAGSAVSWR